MYTLHWWEWGPAKLYLSGSTGVYIGGSWRHGLVMRMYGGRVSSGSSTVLIDESKGELFSELVSAWEHSGNS